MDSRYWKSRYEQFVARMEAKYGPLESAPKGIREHAEELLRAHKETREAEDYAERYLRG